MKNYNKGQVKLMLNNVFNARYPLEVLEDLEDIIWNLSDSNIDDIFKRRIAWARERNWQSNCRRFFTDSPNVLNRCAFNANQLKKNLPS